MDTFINLCLKDRDSITKLLHSYAAGGDRIDVEELQCALEDIGIDEKDIAHELFSQTKPFDDEECHKNLKDKNDAFKSKRKDRIRKAELRKCTDIVETIVSTYSQSKEEILLLKKIKDVVESEGIYSDLSSHLRKIDTSNRIQTRINVDLFLQTVDDTISNYLRLSENEKRILPRPFLSRNGNKVDYETFLGVIETVHNVSPRLLNNVEDDFIGKEVEDILDILSRLRYKVKSAQFKGVDFLESFDHFDQNGDGIITSEEFRQGLSELGLFMSEEHVHQVLHLFKSTYYDDEFDTAENEEEVSFVRYFQFLRFIDNDCDSTGGYPDDELKTQFKDPKGRLKKTDTPIFMYHDVENNGPFVAGLCDAKCASTNAEEKELEDEVGVFVRHSYTSAGYVRQVVKLPKNMSGRKKQRQFKIEKHKLLPHKGKYDPDKGRKSVHYTGILGEQKNRDPLSSRDAKQKNTNFIHTNLYSIVKRLGYKADARNDYPKPCGKSSLHFTRNILHVPSRKDKRGTLKENNEVRDEDRSVTVSEEFQRNRLYRFSLQSFKLHNEFEQLFLIGTETNEIFRESNEKDIGSLKSQTIKDSLGVLFSIANLDKALAKQDAQVNEAILAHYSTGLEKNDTIKQADSLHIIELMLNLAEAYIQENNPEEGLPIAKQAYEILNLLPKSSKKPSGKLDSTLLPLDEKNNDIDAIYFEGRTSANKAANQIWAKRALYLSKDKSKDNPESIHFNIGIIQKSNSLEEFTSSFSSLMDQCPEQETKTKTFSWHDVMSCIRQKDNIYQNWKLEIEASYSDMQLNTLKGVFERSKSDQAEAAKLSTLKRNLEGDKFLQRFVHISKLIDELDNAVTVQKASIQKIQVPALEWEQLLVAVRKFLYIPDVISLKTRAFCILGMAFLMSAKSKDRLSEKKLKNARVYLESSLFELEDIVDQEEYHPALLKVYLGLAEVNELEGEFLQKQSKVAANKEADEYLCSRAGRNQVKAMVKRIVETSGTDIYSRSNAQLRQNAEMESRKVIRTKITSSYRGREKKNIANKSLNAQEYTQKSIQLSERNFGYMSLHTAYVYRKLGDFFFSSGHQDNIEEAAEAYSTSLKLYKSIRGNSCAVIPQIAERLATIHQRFGDIRSSALNLEIAAQSLQLYVRSLPLQELVKKRQLCKLKDLWKNACMLFRSLDAMTFSGQAESASEQCMEVTLELYGHDSIELARALKLCGECKMESGKDAESRRSLREAKRILIELNSKHKRDRKQRTYLLKEIDELIHSSTASLVNIAKSLHEQDSIDNLNASWLQ